ncbi:MAG: DUF4279 domain-containing protein [Candidatus Brocadiaceae bacterium]|nr:DUF4279 domain-containing protein [Candidatus Brocadiaceae bacterium]
MANEDKWSSASLRISSESITLNEICEELNTRATCSHEKGTPVNPRNSNSPLRQENLWILKSSLDDTLPLEKHIEELVNFLEEKIDVLKKMLPKCEIEMFCGFSSTCGQGGCVLASDLLKRISLFPIDIVLDLYPPEVSGNDEE